MGTVEILDGVRFYFPNKMKLAISNLTCDWGLLRPSKNTLRGKVRVVLGWKISQKFVVPVIISMAEGSNFSFLCYLGLDNLHVR